ncbi:basigin isoform X1 [Perognathus longimembris pacificus]|uniref:basigin isoform X1 n=1 Tax=Perognathus longimembris pacificus TaxID=214514 RepID=UPI002018EF57|nr:basigin isoform X1 [Perognathus longimembris pacificus]
MAAAVFLALGFALLGVQGASATAGTVQTSMQKVNSKIRLTCTLDQSSEGVTGHRWMRGDKVVKEDTLSGLTTEFEMDEKTRSGNFSCIFLPEPLGRAEIIVSGPPDIKAMKKSTHGEQGSSVTIICTSEAHPGITSWAWYKSSDSRNEPITIDNKKYSMNSTGLKSELTIKNLEAGSDPGTYLCNGTNLEGSDAATVTLRVHSHLAALWPFLGIVAEVLVLLAIIFICEKRQKPSRDADADEDELGSAPLKSSGHNLDKDKNVRQRTSS